MAKVLQQRLAGTVQQRTVLDQDQIVNDWQQPVADTIKADNQQIRARRDARKMDWGWPVMRIPLLDLELLKQRNPELASLDGATKRRAWLRFLRSPESLPYRVQPKTGGATNRSVGGI